MTSEEYQQLQELLKQAATDTQAAQQLADQLSSMNQDKQQEFVQEAQKQFTLEMQSLSNEVAAEVQAQQQEQQDQNTPRPTPSSSKVKRLRELLEEEEHLEMGMMLISMLASASSNPNLNGQTLRGFFNQLDPATKAMVKATFDKFINTVKPDIQASAPMFAQYIMLQMQQNPASPMVQQVRQKLDHLNITTNITQALEDPHKNYNPENNFKDNPAVKAVEDSLHMGHLMSMLMGGH